MIYLCRGDDVLTSVLNRCGVTSLGQRCTVRHISVMENGGEFHAYHIVPLRCKLMLLSKALAGVS